VYHLVERATGTAADNTATRRAVQEPGDDILLRHILFPEVWGILLMRPRSFWACPTCAAGSASAGHPREQSVFKFTVDQLRYQRPGADSKGSSQGDNGAFQSPKKRDVW